MSVTRVRMYKSDDGRLHETITDANKHNVQYKLLTNIKTLLDSSGNNSAPSTTHISIVNRPELAVKLRDELNKVLDYHKNYTGKIKKNVKV